MLHRGGHAPRCGTRPCRGARDTTPPRGDRPLDIPYRLYFAGTSTTWGGAPCFIDVVEELGHPDAGPGLPHHLGAVRRRRRPGERSSCDLADRSGTRRPGPRAQPPASGPAATRTCSVSVRDGDVPVLTFTSPSTMAQAELGSARAGLPQDDDRRPARVAQDARRRHHHLPRCRARVLRRLVADALAR